jgi:Ca-activated chloride channel family protein
MLTKIVEIHWDGLWFALLFLAIPLAFGAAALLRHRGGRHATIRFSSLAPFRGIPPTARLRLRIVVPVLRAAALALIVLALMRPQKGTEMTPESSKGVSILMTVDRSGSMETPDFEIDGKDVSRMDAVKKVFRDFVKGGGRLRGRPNDEIGLVTFSGYPVPVAPLTLDHGAVLQFLDHIETFQPRRDRAGRFLDDEETVQEETRTAIGDGLALAVDRMKDLKSKSKVIILLSDGVSNFGQLSPEEAAELARTYGIKVHAIGIGQSGMVLREVDDPFFGKRRVQMRSELDEETLRRVAEVTGGKYWNAATTGALEEVYGEIDKLERSEIESARFYRFDEKFQWAAIPALALLVLEVLLAQTVFRRIP